MARVSRCITNEYLREDICNLSAGRKPIYGNGNEMEMAILAKVSRCITNEYLAAEGSCTELLMAAFGFCLSE